MDDAQPAPGSWQASDGKWYGPQEHPDPAYRARWPATVEDRPSPPPLAGPPAGVIDRRPGGRRPVGGDLDPPAGSASGGLARRVLLGVLAVAVLVGVGVTAYVLAGGSGDDGAGGTGATVEGDPQTDPDDTTPETVATDEPQVVMVGDGLVVTFPGNWAVTEPGDGPAAEELFPDDSAAAAVFDQNLSQQDEGALVFAADRATFDGGVLTSVVASFVTYADGAGFDSVASVAQPSLEAAGGVVERQGDLTLGESEAEALRVNYRVTTPGLEFTGLQVVVDGGDGAFVLTFQTDSSGDDTAVVDAIVDSIEIE